MLSLGFWEIVVIGSLLLVVVGPERLPKVMRFLGKQYGMVRRAADEMRRAFVLEADRQDAEDRYKALQDRREAAKSAREAALEAAGGASEPQDNPLPPPADEPQPAEASLEQERPAEDASPVDGVDP